LGPQPLLRCAFISERKPMTQPRNLIVHGAFRAAGSWAARVGAAPRSGGLKAPI